MVKYLIYLNDLYDFQYWAVIEVLGFNVFYWILLVKMTKCLIFCKDLCNCVCVNLKKGLSIISPFFMFSKAVLSFPAFPGPKPQI